MTEETKAAGAARSVRSATTKKAKTVVTERGTKPSPAENATTDPERSGEVTPEERWNMIAEAAYYIAEKRGFSDGHPAEDWRQAEAEIDAMLAKKRH